MTVHNLAEYVKFHQEKLRQQQQTAQSFTSSPASASTSTSTAPKTPRRGGVNHIHSKASFDTSVIETSKGKLVVVDFFATWCGPCKAIAPKVVEMSNQYEGVDFVKIDVDEVPEVAQSEGVRAMPTFGFYKDGQKVHEVVGADPRKLLSAIEQFQ